MTTTKGEIMLALEFEKTPITVANFVALAEGNLEYDTIEISKPYYDGVTFHRVIANFMIQGGDPTATGSGGPGYSFPDEFDTSLTHKGPGILSMANAGPGTNGSQFFITHKATPHLDGKHSVFGHVVTGQEVVDKIEQGDAMEKVEIIRVGKAAKKFKASKTFSTKVTELKEAEAKILAERNGIFYEEMIKKFPEAKQTESGLMYQIIKKGDGVYPAKNKTAEVHYTGTFLDGNKFDSSVDRGQTFQCQVGQGRVIKGWDEGIPMCDVGGQIKLIIPYWLAYGENGRSSIPPKSTLIFDIEVFGVK
ncbi:peptidylprolyl isomerase [Crocinitomix catalasitica]|uniref:peptidylprolyl isomerase n=1 Tax=Crocinitomix catalasitica TaxID=184607 RepID=UPI000482860A|nr:peptidylprolyl isomerase [Crocinitomix catalasitica]